MVSPSFSFTVRLISSATFSGAPNSLLVPLISSQHSSIPKGSIRSVYRSYIFLASLLYLRYSSKCGGTITSPLHFDFADATVSAAFTPCAFASSFFASTIPCRSSTEPHTATGYFLSSGFSLHSTDAKKLFISQ